MEESSSSTSRRRRGRAAIFRLTRSISLRRGEITRRVDRSMMRAVRRGEATTIHVFRDYSVVEVKVSVK